MPFILQQLLCSFKVSVEHFLFAMNYFCDYLRLLCKNSVLDKCGLSKVVLTILFFIVYILYMTILLRKLKKTFVLVLFFLTIVLKIIDWFLSAIC